MSNVLTARIRFFIFPPIIIITLIDGRSLSSIIEKYPTEEYEKWPRLEYTCSPRRIFPSRGGGRRGLNKVNFLPPIPTAGNPKNNLSLSRSHNHREIKIEKNGGARRGGGGSHLHILIFQPGERSFTGNIAKFIGLRFAMIFYASRPGGWRGPTHGGALDVTPYVWPPWKRDGTRRRRRRRAAETCAITSLLFRYLYQCARCSRPPKSS